MTEKKIEKKNKKKGLVRISATVPFLIFCLLTYFYFNLFFDRNIRSAGEWIGTRINGAEVNIANVKSSFWNAYLYIDDIQVTDKDTPSHNLVQIGKFKFDLTWQALLRAKFVVESANVEQIQIFSKRKRPGRVLPPENESNQAKKKIEDGVLNQAKEDFNENILGDVANVLGGTKQGQQIAKINEKLFAEKKIQELQKELKKKEGEWKKRLETLPKQKDLDSLTNRAKALKFNANNPQQFAQSLQQLQKIVQEADQKIKLVNSTSSDLQSDIKTYEAEIKKIDSWVKKDVAELQKRLKIPNINVQQFTMGLFGRLFAEKLAKFKPYMDMAREYMPPKKSVDQKQNKEAEVIRPKKRADGKNYEFPTKKSYPLVWIKK